MHCIIGLCTSALVKVGSVIIIIFYSFVLAHLYILRQTQLKNPLKTFKHKKHLETIIEIQLKYVLWVEISGIKNISPVPFNNFIKFLLYTYTEKKNNKCNMWIADLWPLN